VLLTVVGCSTATPDATAPDGASPTTEATQQPPVSVEVATAEVTTLRPILDLVGQIVAIPEKTAVISPQLGGWVRKLDVVEGQSVKAGDLLVELDTRSAEVAVTRAEATVAEKSAAVKRLKSGYLPEEIAGARQDAGNAAAMVDGLTNELKALKNLLDRSEISPVIYQTKAEAVKSAEAALASAQEKVKLLEAGTRPEMIAESQGLLDVAKADLEQAKLTLNWCSITSPIDGVVVQLLARQGQFFDRAVVLATVMNLDEVFVQIRIPSAQFAKISIGTEIKIELASLPGKTFAGQVTRISGQADLATGNVIVFALVENPDHLLRPGLSCQVHVSLPEVPSALTIPIAAVADNSGTPVVTVIRDSKAYETEVTLGVETSDQVQILSGLKAGDQVTTAGGYGLPEACPVVVADVHANQ
jgi:multidrug efflux pump subunit AcrA (membrane-fusion protein)